VYTVSKKTVQNYFCHNQMCANIIWLIIITALCNNFVSTYFVFTYLLSCALKLNDDDESGTSAFNMVVRRREFGDVEIVPTSHNFRRSICHLCAKNFTVGGNLTKFWHIILHSFFETRCRSVSRYLLPSVEQDCWRVTHKMLYFHRCLSCNYVRVRYNIVDVYI